MKKIICILALLSLFWVPGQSGEQELSFPSDSGKRHKTKQHENILQRYDRFEVFQMGILYNFPRYTWDSSVYGLKLGVPISAGIGKVKGLELALIGAATQHINGTQLAFGYCNAKAVQGLQLSLINIFDNGSDAWQVGIFNKANDASVQLGLINYAVAGSCQFGLINIISNGALPFSILFNYADTAPKDPYAGRK